MAQITVKDLPQGSELDRQAMQAIAGGARVRGRLPAADAAALRHSRIVDYPPGFGRDGPTNRPRGSR